MKFRVSLLLPLFLFACSGVPPANESAASETAGRGFVPDSTETESRMIAYSVSMELSVKEPAEARRTLIALVSACRGYIIREQDDFLSVRLPAEYTDGFVEQARVLGKVESELKTGTDITDQYRDDVIRLESLKSVRDRYLALLEKADAVADILSIEIELERINTEIEVFEGRIKYAESSVAYSSVNIRIMETIKPGPIGWIFYGLYRGIAWLFVWN